ncbi:MAG: S24/S26 family peptidase [Oscillospiraceae bacterium]|nr:S24/S26 family peptidase [Oscillospiraceae bacterium]
MESKVKVVDPEVLMGPLLSAVEEAESVPLVISGSSMTPFLVHGRDTVFLSKVTRPLKKGDMILYRRDNGAYILHRICRAEGETYTLVGDAQTLLERGIRRDQVLALVTAVRRKGKLLRKGSFWWDFFEKVWINVIPLRPMIVAAYARIKR